MRPIRPAPTTALVRMHLALLTITGCVAVSWGIYSPAARGLAWLLAAAFVFGAPYWLLRGGWRVTLAMAGLAAVGCAAALGPAIAFGEERASPGAAGLILPQVGALLLAGILMALRTPAPIADALAMAVVIGLTVAYSARPPASLATTVAVPSRITRLNPRATAAAPSLMIHHYLEGGGSPDPEMLYRLQPYSRSMQFYPSNPRGYFTDLGDLGPTHWLAWTLQDNSSTPGRGRVSITGDRGEMVRLDMTAAGPAESPQFGYGCNHWSPAPLSPCSLTFRARADAPRSATLCAYDRSENHGPAQCAQLALGTEWQTFALEFSAPKEKSALTVRLDLPGSDTAIELAEFELRSAGQLVPCSAPFTRYALEYTTNNLGFRGRDVAFDPPQGVFRIACLGDSFTFGMGVHEPDCYPRALERRLNEAGDRRFEVINCGRPGYNTGNERVCYEREVRRYRPHILILQICVNDFEHPPGDINVFPPNDEVDNKADSFRRCQAEVERLARLCRSDGAALAVMLYRINDRTHGWLRIHEMLKHSPELHDVPILDIGDALEAGSRGRELWAHETDFHPNDLAHRLAAEALERFLREHKLIPTATE